MKKTSFALIAAFFLLLTAGCKQGPIESLSFDSPDKDRNIKVTGERSSPAGPIMATVKLTVAGGTKSFSFEHQAGSLTKENCTAEWFNNNRAKLTFMLDDGESWEVECYLLDNRVEAVKVFKVGGQSIFH